MVKRRWGYIVAVLIGASAASTAPAQYTGPPVMPPLIVRPPEAMDEPAPRTLSFRERLRQTAIGQFWRGLQSRPTARPTAPRPAVTEIRPTIIEATSATSAGCGDLRTWINQPVATIEPELA